MITHFQWEPLHKNLPGWKISFYFNKQAVKALYHKDGSIEWTANPPSEADETKLKSMIHDLMIFHVYE
ncbi:YheE family protein [Peribacillus frigoritolerans]|uniref:YheE family protein n=1 Tax=Peribacillus frigoritolerans TaxID=450367 RepID=UPI00207AE644|nr:YheE family protein [Peribacillus frigoritolerans]USK76062.1 YheE family protein [Peribacillus frigoritolerans]